MTYREHRQKGLHTVDEWPKLFLVYMMRNINASADVRIVTVDASEYESAQVFLNVWFADPAVIRIYELRQCYSTDAQGRVRGQ